MEDRLDEIEEKLNQTISRMETYTYQNDIKNKKQFENWLGILFKEFKKELKKTKEEIIKEVKNEIKNGNKR